MHSKVAFLKRVAVAKLTGSLDMIASGLISRLATLHTALKV